MRRFVFSGFGVLGTVAMGMVTILLACSSSDTEETPGTDGGDASLLDSGVADSGPSDADAGADADADVDDGDFVVPDASVVCEASPCVTKIVGSGESFCAVLSDGRVSCWGDNFNGQLGQDPEQSSLATPSTVTGLAGVTHVGLNSTNTCARVTGGSVYCWGDSELINHAFPPPDGGDPPYGSIPTPTRLDTLPSAENISVGLRYACVTVSDGSLTCWGANDHRELGRGKTESDMVEPAKATLLTQTATSVIAGSTRTFVIAPDGSVLSWGANTQFGSENFLLGRDSSEDPNERPTLVPLLSRVRSIGTTFNHACAVAGRFVQCWGANSNGQLGRGTQDYVAYVPGRSLLAAVTDADDADASTTDHDVPVQVVAGSVHSCAVLGSGRVYCWGNAGRHRVLGSQVNADIVRGTPTRIDGFGGPAVALATAYTSTCALLRSGAVECWGANDRGQLGSGAIDYEPHPSPVRVSFPQ